MMAARSRSGSVVDEVACGQAFGAHAHVERAVLAEREAALGLVELHGRDAEVEGNPVDRGDAFTFGDLAHLGIAAEDEFQASGEVRFETRGVAGSARVAVDGKHAAARSLEQAAAIAAGAEGSIDEDACRRGVRAPQ